MSKLEELFQNGDVWFSLSDKKAFLEWAKEQGCIWMNGTEIDPDGDCFFHMAVHQDKKIANVAMYAWFAEHFKDKPKYVFEDFLKGKLTVPKDKVIQMPI